MDKPGTRYDHAGVDRQTYEEPCCGSNRPHDPHMYSPMRSFTVNCAGKAEPPRTSISLSDLTEALEGLDIFSNEDYANELYSLNRSVLAERIFNYRKDNDA